MTRVDAHILLEEEYWVDGLEYKSCNKLIDQIYDAHEVELKAKDERIEAQSSVIILVKMQYYKKMSI